MAQDYLRELRKLTASIADEKLRRGSDGVLVHVDVDHVQLVVEWYCISYFLLCQYRAQLSYCMIYLVKYLGLLCTCAVQLWQEMYVSSVMLDPSPLPVRQVYLLTLYIAAFSLLSYINDLV